MIYTINISPSAIISDAICMEKRNVNDQRPNN